MIRVAEYLSPVGRLGLAEREGALVGLWIAGRQSSLLTEGEEVRREDSPLLRQTADWLDRYFAGERPSAGELKLAPEGSPFRQAVWELLREIPYGQTVTYGEIAGQVAARLGRKRMAAQAVGGAVGRNPIAIVIPCHRVLGGGGALIGYAGGLDIKIALLTHEGAWPIPR